LCFCLVYYYFIWWVRIYFLSICFHLWQNWIYNRLSLWPILNSC
jgi:hypothetical protein